MSSLYLEGLTTEMQTAYNVFDDLCKWHRVPYSIDCDLPEEQSYLVIDRDLAPRIAEQLKDRLDGTKVSIQIDENRRDGILFNFTIVPLSEEDVVEDRLKFGTGKHTLDQSSFPSEGESQSHGGIKTPQTRAKRKRKKRKKVDECYYPGVKGTLTCDLRGHDNVTVIPKGAKITIVDADRHLPDVEWDGRIINVNYDGLWEAFKPDNAFQNRLELKLTPPEEVRIQGLVQVVNPDILAHMHQRC